MASFPEEQDYYVVSSESIRTGGHAGEHIGATSIADDDHIVRGIAGEKTAWSLKYVDRENGIFKVTHAELGHHAGIPENSDGSTSHASRLEEEQHWTLKKTDHGFSVSREFNGEELYSHLYDDGSIKAAPSSEGITSWSLVPVGSL